MDSAAVGRPCVDDLPGLRRQVGGSEARGVEPRPQSPHGQGAADFLDELAGQRLTAGPTEPDLASRRKL